MKYKFILAIFLFIFNISQLVNATSYSVNYQLKNYYTTSLKIRVEVPTKQLGAFVLEKSRQWAGDRKPTKIVYCADDNRVVPYNEPQVCSLIYWTIELQREPITGLGSRADGDYYLNNGQWLVRESKNFPRLQGDPAALVCINNDCKSLPANDRLGGSLFLIWGKQPTRLEITGIKFEIFSDRQAEALDKEQLVQLVEPDIVYLNNTFMPQLNNYIKKPIKIVLLASRIGSLKDSGGSAGDHAFLVNYYVKDGKEVDSLQNNFNELFVHEYIHMLAPCNLFPRWACESLADYYTYKALTHGEVNTRALRRWKMVKNTDANYAIGLYVLSESQRKTKQWDYYKLFYAKGAAFWNELDILLHKENDNLDNYLNLITIGNDSSPTFLPDKFINKMNSIIGENQFIDLANKYLY